jgi:dienelactone hydrolase
MNRPLVALLVAALLLPSHGSGQALETTISADLHPFAEPLRAWERFPAGADPAAPVPACVVVHGSGGLLREPAVPGNACGPALEPRFADLAERLAAHGVASILADSFSSRDPRFCEDNDEAFFAFAPPPFVNPGDVHARDAAYDTRRIVIRTVDLVATMAHACADPRIDCSRLCLIGTSNGGSGILGYSAQDLQRHLAQFTDIGTRRTHESSSAFANRAAALANMPGLAADIAQRVAARPLPRFAHAISPGCALRALVPTVDPGAAGFDPALHLTDLYYAAAPIVLHLDIGTADDVPDACWNGGIRERQARAFEALAEVAASRYRIETHDGAGHDLLGERADALHAKIAALVRIAFFPQVFRDGMESD